MNKKYLMSFSLLVVILFCLPMVSGTGNTTMGCYPSSEMIMVGDNFNVTVWLNADENISAWLVGELNFNETILGMINANSVELDPYWKTGFYENGTIHNDNGNITDVQAFIMVDSTTNTTIFTVNFIALKSGLCYFNLKEAEAYNPDNVLNTWYNTSFLINPKVTTVGCYPSSNVVTVGDTFTITFWLNAGENVDSWLVNKFNYNETILGMVDANSVCIDPYWKTGFYDSGTIHNDNGNITDVQAFIMSETIINTTIFSINFTARETGLCYFNLTDIEAYSGGINVLNNCYNTSVIIHPQKPSGFSATDVYQNRIDLNWTKQTGMDKTYIRYKSNSYPTSLTDGIELYNDTGISTSHTGLNDGVIIYYSAWGWNETYGLFSIDYAMANGQSTMDCVLVKIEPTQFIILILLILFCMFIWISYRIPDLAGEKKSLHYIPFSGGLFVIFGAFDFISLAIILNDNYSIGMIGGFLTVIGIILLLYGVLKAFYYE